MNINTNLSLAWQILFFQQDNLYLSLMKDQEAAEFWIQTSS